MAWLALSRSYRQTGDSHRVASPRLFACSGPGKSRHLIGRPSVPPDVRALVRELSTANPLWGAPRIHGELLKLGIAVSQSTVAKYDRDARVFASMDDGQLVSECDDFHVQRGARLDEKSERVEHRNDNGRHACRLSENARNLNRRNMYEVLGSHT